MKHTSRRRSSKPKPEPAPDVMRRYIETMVTDHQQEWQRELMDEAPHFEYLLGIHLRLVELEHLEGAVQELL